MKQPFGFVRSSEIGLFFLIKLIPTSPFLMMPADLWWRVHLKLQDLLLHKLLLQCLDPLVLEQLRHIRIGHFSIAAKAKLLMSRWSEPP